MAAFSERELINDVLECTPQGRLDRDAVGWSRRPLHRCNLSGSWPRKKRWDYWCVTSDDFVLSITYAHFDYLGIADVWFMLNASPRPIQKSVPLPFAPGFSSPDTVEGGAIRFDALGLRLAMLPDAGGTRLQVSFLTGGQPFEADVYVERPPGHETLSVLVPWSDSLFQYTSKHNTRPASGVVRLGDREYRFSPHNHAFGCLDYGRGIWPYQMTWNWASASGVQDGRALGLNLGGKWTDGTGSTENGICAGGRLHKISEDLEWSYDRGNWIAPWRIRAPETGKVDLTFTPFFEKPGSLNLGVLSTELHTLFGHFDGAVVTDSGERIPVSRLFGWAEEHRARW